MYTFNCFKKSKIYNALCHIFSSFAYFCRRSNIKIKYQTEPWSHTFCFFSLLVPFVHSSSLSHVYFVCIYVHFFLLFMRSLPAAEPLSSWVTGCVFFLLYFFLLVQKTLLLRLSWLYYLTTAIFTPTVFFVVKSGPGKILQKIKKTWWFGFGGEQVLF